MKENDSGKEQERCSRKLKYVKLKTYIGRIIAPAAAVSVLRPSNTSVYYDRLLPIEYTTPSYTHMLSPGRVGSCFIVVDTMRSSESPSSFCVDDVS